MSSNGLALVDLFPGYNGKPGDYESSFPHFYHDKPWLRLSVVEKSGRMQFSFSKYKSPDYAINATHPGYRFEWECYGEEQALESVVKFFNDRGLMA